MEDLKGSSRHIPLPRVQFTSRKQRILVHLLLIRTAA